MEPTAGTSSSTCTREQHHRQAGGYAPSALEIDDPQFGHAWYGVVGSPPSGLPSAGLTDRHPSISCRGGARPELRRVRASRQNSNVCKDTTVPLRDPLAQPHRPRIGSAGNRTGDSDATPIPPPPLVRERRVDA